MRSTVFQKSMWSPERSKNVVSHVAIYPASHYIVPRDKMQKALTEIRDEMEERVAYFKANDKLIEAQRIMERTNYDMEMLTEIGFSQGNRKLFPCSFGQGLRAAVLIPCLTIFRMIFCCSWTSLMLPCRRFAECMRGIRQERRIWWIMDSACLLPLITARLPLMSFTANSIR